jgi:hypothetical protein
MSRFLIQAKYSFDTRRRGLDINNFDFPSGNHKSAEKRNVVGIIGALEIHSCVNRFLQQAGADVDTCFHDNHTLSILYLLIPYDAIL